jgi:hypothetical protein
MTHTTTLPVPTLSPVRHYAAVAADTPSVKAPRHDMYCHIHKALRQCMAHTLRRLGALDVTEAEERDAVLDSVDAMLGLLRSHLQHENDFVHTAIEARQPGGASHTANDHVQHQEAIRNLEDETLAVRNAQEEQRQLLAHRLYRHLAAFVGENLVHMQFEETRGNATLWALYSDEELLAIHGRLVASIPPAEMALVVRWMAAALSVPELAMLFADMRQKAPPAAFEALLDVARTQLDERRWGQLARALGRSAVPGLMTA